MVVLSLYEMKTLTFEWEVRAALDVERPSTISSLGCAFVRDFPGCEDDLGHDKTVKVETNT